jgi:carbonic anhydrase
MIDYVFRYDPSQPGLNRKPTSASEAHQALVEGNRVFSQWMQRCRSIDSSDTRLQYIVPINGLDGASQLESGEFPSQEPFAVVLGCSDARVPTEMLFGQGFNDLFVVRVAGHVLGDAVMGTIDYSLQALRESVRILVVLGHTNCGAVKGAVDAYLDPKKLWSKSNSPFLRLTFQRIFVAVRESDNAIREVWGADAPAHPEYRAALIETSICLNAAHTAFTLRQQVESASDWEIEVVFGVYDVRTHQVSMPIHPVGEPSLPEHVELVHAPSHPRDFSTLARQLATRLSPVPSVDD